MKDVLRKRKSFEPVGWQMFARSLKDVNTSIDLVELWLDVHADSNQL